MGVKLKTLYEDSIKMDEIKEEWNKYKEFLIKKYPAKDGEEWKFTCEHHKRIDSILNKGVE